jgi:hypothetical protein
MISGVNEGAIVESFYLISECVWTWVDVELPKLPQEVRPTHFGDEGRIRRKATNTIAERERFTNFRDRHRGGFCLYGDRIMIDLTSHARVPSSIYFSMTPEDPRLLNCSVQILESFSRCGAAWGFAGEWDEYAARNQFTIKYVDKGSCQGFIGRDFRRYVPGLYWLNYFSNDYALKRAIDFAELASRLNATVVPLDNGTILRLYEKPADWRARQGEVADVIHQTKNFFSMRNVQIPTNLSQRNPEHFSWSPFTEWP